LFGKTREKKERGPTNVVIVKSVDVNLFAKGMEQHSLSLIRLIRIRWDKQHLTSGCAVKCEDIDPKLMSAFSKA